MYGMHAFVCLRLEREREKKKQTLIAGAMSWPPCILGWRVFFICPRGPWEMRSWNLRGGKWVEKGEARGKGGVPEITLLTSQLSTGACPAYLR